jgi:chorismate dehydratase
MRIAASSYSNTAPLVWSFLYGENRGRAEVILDNAPARSAQLLEQSRVDAALVPVIAYQSIDDLLLVPDVCVGTTSEVRSVCLVTRGEGLPEVRSVALDVSSKTSVALTKIIFREFLAFEPEWHAAEPNIHAMLAKCDAALLIGDPALTLPRSSYEVFDIAAVWKKYTGLGFVFAMWMTRDKEIALDFAAARDEGLARVEEIAANYATQTGLGRPEIERYLTENISYTADENMRRGMNLFFELAAKHQLISTARPLRFTR